MRYLTLSELIYINGRILNNAKLMSGQQKVRDLDLLEAAALRPSTSAFGQDAYSTLNEKAAALLHSLARNHPFTDGNKRTAAVALIFMLEVNGQQVNWQPEAALAHILAVAQGKSSLDDFAVWLPLIPCESAPEEDAERDMRAIDRIVEDHRWLLAELDKQ